MPDFYLKKDTTLAPLDVRLLSATGARIDVSLATVRFRMRKKGGATNVIDRAATILDAVQGLVRYQWQTSDAALIGDYEAEFEVTYPDTNNRIFPSPGFISIRITDSLD
jgi:BppU N-terminal domain